MAGNKGANKAASCSHGRKNIGGKDRLVETIGSMRVMEELRAREEKYRTIVENANEGILVIDQDYNVTYSNQKFADMVGYTVEELLSGTLFMFIDSGYNDLAYANLEKRQTGNALVSDFKLRHKNGSAMWVISKTSPLFDRNANYTGTICFVTDISERKLIEKALRESESSLALAQKIAHLGNWERDLKTNEMKWSDEAYNIYGVKSGDFIPDYKSFISFVHPEDREIPWRLSNAALDEGKQYSADYRIVRADGTVRYVHAESYFIIKDENGVPIKMFGTVQDITDRKLTEQALRMSEEKFRALAETVPTAVCLFQGDKFTYINPAVERMSGYTKEEFFRQEVWNFLPPHYRDLTKARHESRKQGLPVPSSYEIQFINKSGEARWIDISLGDVNIGGVPMRIATAFDITERKRAEKALYESDERLNLCVATAGLGTFDWDIVNDRHVWSPRTYEIYGLPPDAPLSLDHMARYIYPGDRQDTVIMAGLDPAGPGEYSMEYRIIRASDSAIRRVYLKARVFFTGEGAQRRAVRVLGAIQDITERKLAEEALGDAKTQAELYLDLMGHDINNMHQIALGYLELARDTNMDGDRQEFMDKSIEVLQRSTILIKNVRKLQKLQDGVLRKEIVDICPVLADVKREYGAIPAKPIKLSLNGLTHCDVRADELLNDVFSNLVTNAIKHTGDQANISIALEKVKDNDCCYYRVSVEDNGPGIPDNFKGVIFNRMLKGTKKAKGMGLGLYLVKSLVDSYAGRVWVEDRVPGDHTKGAKFVVMLPAVDQIP
jgi:PAS domain S-box-containing protein